MRVAGLGWVCCVALSVLPGQVRGQAAGDTLQQDEAAQLRAQMQQMQQALAAMQQRLEAMEARQPATSPPSVQPAPALLAVTGTPASSVPGRELNVLPARDSVADPSTAASRPDSAAGPTDPELKGFFALPGTDTQIRLGGYAKLDAIADSREAGDREQFIPSAFPVGGAHRDQGHFGLHAKQTRFSFEARRPTSHGNLRFYLENDFFGSSDGYQFRLRHAYGQLGNTYAGYGYSSFVDADSLPDTLDFAGPGGAGYLLVAGIHHGFNLGRGVVLTVAAENPQTQLTLADDQAVGVERVPDVTVSARLERPWGHLQLGTVTRRLAVDGERGSHRWGGGAQLSGSLAIGEQDLLLWGVLGGRGLGRYTAELTGSGLDAVVGDDGRLQALSLVGGFAGYTHYWTPQWRSNLIYGQMRLERNDALALDAFRSSRYGVLNLLWSPAPSWTMGMEVLYGQLEQQGGTRGDTVRVQGSLQYSFIK